MNLTLIALWVFSGWGGTYAMKIKFVPSSAVFLVVLTLLWTGCATTPEPPGFGIKLSANPEPWAGVTHLVIQGTSFTPGVRVAINIHNAPFRADIQKSAYPKANGKFEADQEIAYHIWYSPQPPGDILVSARDTKTDHITWATIDGNKFVGH